MSTLVTWWTTTGWQRQEAPAAWQRLEADDGADGADYSEARKVAGFTYLTSNGSDDTGEVTVWEDEESHVLLVEVWDVCSQIGVYFVDQDNRDAYMTTEYLALVERMQNALQKPMERLARAVVAFIRHGSGEDTIDEWGDETQDDVRRHYEAAQRRRAEREKAEAKTFTK